MNQLRYPIILSIIAALATLGLKAAAWLMTDSVGLLSDALESGINLLAAVTAYFSLLYAARPIDETHTYGHEKIEFFSSGLEGMLIAVAAVGIFFTAVLRFITPVPLESLGTGTIISAVAALINLAVARVLLRIGRRHDSIVLEADGHHLMTDVWTSVAVIAGLGLVRLTGKLWLDPTMAILMAFNILFTAYRLVRRSFNGLMDHALSAAEQLELRTTINSALEPGTTFHALRTRRAGMRRFADCHLLVPGAWSVQQAHDLAERLEQTVVAAMPGLELTLHIEPIDAAASYRDSALLGFEPKPPT
jgi:cation diffusion facilitator family transporter